MTAKRWLALIGLLLVAFFVAKEIVEPHLWLFVDDLLRPKPHPLSLPLDEGLAVRLYSDTRPHVGKVARLQKGLVLMIDGNERIEEGFGFGLPLAVVGEQAYLARTATMEQEGQTFVKRYELDTLDTPSGFLRRKYVPVPSIGTVVISYTVNTDGLDVVVDLSGLEAPWNQVFLMNEQGARFFTSYEEPGLVVEGAAFGIWQATNSATGCILAQDRSIQFCVETEEEMPRFYGRERYKQYYWVGIYSLSWAGIDLELKPPLERFEYRILVERLGDE